MSLSRTEAEKDGVVVPLTQEDYCIKTKIKSDNENVDMADFYDDDYDIEDDDDEDYSDNDNGELVIFSFRGAYKKRAFFSFVFCIFCCAIRI